MGTVAVVVLLVAVAMPGPVTADEQWALNLGQWSWHWDDVDNQDHHLVAIEYRGWTVGGMINSDDNTSLIAGYHFRLFPKCSG